jgi:hypothetical protein
MIERRARGEVRRHMMRRRRIEREVRGRSLFGRGMERRIRVRRIIRGGRIGEGIVRGRVRLSGVLRIGERGASSERIVFDEFARLKRTLLLLLLMMMMVMVVIVPRWTTSLTAEARDMRGGRQWRRREGVAPSHQIADHHPRPVWLLLP